MPRDVPVRRGRGRARNARGFRGGRGVRAGHVDEQLSVVRVDGVEAAGCVRGDVSVSSDGEEVVEAGDGGGVGVRDGGEGSAGSGVRADGAARSRFRMYSNAFLLTYPQSGELSAAECLEHLASISDFEFAAAVREHHHDAARSGHVHAVVRFLLRKDIRRPDYFDFGGHHCNMRKIKSSRTDMFRALNYLQKEYLERVEGAELPAVRGVSSYTELLAQFMKKSGLFQEMAKLLMSGKTIDDLMEEERFLGSLLLHSAKISSFQTQVEQFQERKKLLSWDPADLRAMRCTNPSAQLDWSMIVSWLEFHIRKPLHFRPKQLWIRSAAGVGKSLLCHYLSQRLKVYFYPTETTFHDLWSEDTELIVFDDFAPVSTIQTLLQWSSGDTRIVQKKGGVARKRKAYPFLILSNFAPRYYYSRVDERALDPLVGGDSSRFHYLDWWHDERFPLSQDNQPRRWSPEINQV